MKVKLKISITKDILKQTMFCQINDIQNNCAIAVAIRDVFPKADVQEDYIAPFGRYGVSSEIRLPKNAVSFIEKFDRRDAPQRIKMKPFDFEILIPSYVIGKINIDEIKDLLQNHSTLELVNTNEELNLNNY